jgi:phage tail-like protein
MTSIFTDGALHPGRDANDAAWLVVRTPHDWAGAVLTDVVVDPAPAVMLAPRPLAAGEGDGALVAEVVTADGTRFRAEPDADRVMRRRVCDPGWTVFVGGTGTATGALRRPVALALDERRGLLAIADAGNHRVQLVRIESGEPVAVLGCLDAWGRGVAPPAAGVGRDHALDEPVAIAIVRGWIAIADRAGGRVHLYDDRLRWVRAFAPRPGGASAGFAPAPVAVALVGCAVWVIDAGWSVPVAYGVDGEPIAEPGAAPDALAPWATLARFAPRGELIHGPIDGRADGLAWHRVIVDAAVPAGTAIEVQTFASDDPTLPAVLPWAPARPVAIPVPGVEPVDGVVTRPVLSDHGRWERSRGEPYLRASRPLGRLTGTGPVNTAALEVAWPLAARLRTGDVVELTAPGLPGETLPIAAIDGRAVRAVIRGDAQLYAAGTRLTLIERAGAPPPGGPRVIAELGAGESIDLAAAVADETLYDLDATHGVAALVRAGDVIELAAGAASAIAIVHSIDAGAAIVVLAAPVAGDYRDATVRVAVAAGRLVVDPGALAWTEVPPPGEPIRVHDDLAAPAVPPVLAAIRWVELELGTIWLVPGPAVPFATWTRFSLEPPAATDRGRYLWLRLVLVGATAHPGDAAAIATPIVRAVRLLMPRLSYLGYLPAVYARRDADDPSGAVFLERMLALPEAKLTDVEARYEDVARQLNPAAASADWLRFLAAWYGLVFDPSWPIERRRRLVAAAHDLFARRGTVEGLRRYLEIYTGTSPAIVEGFQYRTNAAGSAVIGGDAVVLGRAALGPAVPDTGALAHTFSIWVFGAGGACGAEVTARAARAIIDSVKPAHTSYELHVLDGAPRVGISTTVGVDTVLLGGELPPSPLGLVPRPPAVLGSLHLPITPRAARAATLGPIPLDDDFTLT